MRCFRRRVIGVRPKPVLFPNVPTGVPTLRRQPRARRRSSSEVATLLDLMALAVLNPDQSPVRDAQT